jgi:hypothetical protein
MTCGRNAANKFSLGAALFRVGLIIRRHITPAAPTTLSLVKDEDMVHQPEMNNSFRFNMVAVLTAVVAYHHHFYSLAVILSAGVGSSSNILDSSIKSLYFLRKHERLMRIKVRLPQIV